MLPTVSAARFARTGVSKAHPEVRRIWFSRFNELEPERELPAWRHVYAWAKQMDRTVDVERLDSARRVHGLLNELRQRHAYVLAMRTLGYSLREIAMTMNLTTKRVRQIEVHAIREMKRLCMAERINFERVTTPARRPVYAWESEQWKDAARCLPTPT